MDLVGVWIGQGSVFPNGIKYNERLTLTLLKSSPLVIVNWQQLTKNAATGEGMHAENGFLRVSPTSGKTELLLSHPFGVNEIYKNCTYDESGGTLEATATEAEGSFQRGEMVKGKRATTVRRVYKLQGANSLVYDVYLGTGGEEPVHHLHCELHRSEEDVACSS